MTDAPEVMSSVAAGLELIDRFHDLAVKAEGKQPQPHGGVVQQTDDTLRIYDSGYLLAEVSARNLRLESWDDKLYRALYRRVEINYDLYLELFSEQPLLSVDERARIKLRMERIKNDMCTDFGEMTQICERVLQVALPDHYQLYQICG